MKCLQLRLVCLAAVAAVVLGLVGPAAELRAAIWSGAAAPDLNWTTDGPGGNWSGGLMPGAADPANFNHAGGAAGAGIVTNVVSGGFTIGSLTYELAAAAPASFFHTTQIAPGQTLLATGGLYVGPNSVGSAADPRQGQLFTADVTVVGPTSTLQVGNTRTNTATMIVGRATGNVSYSSHMYGKLDLSGLGAFAANLNTMVLGQGVDWNNVGIADLTLAANNVISANTIETGRGTGAARIYLGQSNIIRADSFLLNIGKGNPNNFPNFGSLVRFQTGLTAPVLNLTGRSNPGVNLAISYNHTNATGAVGNDLMDLSGGVFNATINELTLGRYAHALAGGSRGTLIMDAGTVTANTVVMAMTTGTVPANTQGALTMRGGSFTVLGGIEWGKGTSTINVEGGAFHSRGTIARQDAAVGQLTLNVGTAGSPATVSISGLPSGSRQVSSFALGAGGTLAVHVNPYSAGMIDAATANLAAGSTVEVRTVTGSSTAVPDQTRWTAGAAVWDATQTNWSHGLPAGFTIGTGTAYDFLQAASLANGGLALVNSPGWTLSWAGNKATVTRTGAALTTGPVRAVIDTAGAAVTRSDHLLVAETPGADAAMLDVQAGSLTIGAAGAERNLTLGSGAAPGQLRQTGGTVNVFGNVLSGSPGTVNLLGGTLNLSGNLQVDHLAVGEGVRTATLNLSSLNGSHTVANTVLLADGAGSRGTIAMVGGTLNLAGGVVTGGGLGSLYVDGSSFDNEVHSPPYGGSPAVATVQGDLKVGELRVGYVRNDALGNAVGGRATLTVIGGDVEIGLGVAGDTFDIARRTVTVAGHDQPDWFSATADFSAASSVHIEVDRLYLGVVRTLADGHPGAGPNTVGTLRLSQSGPNVVDAAEIRLGDVAGGTGASPSASTIVLGASTNVFHVDTLTIGRHKGRGAMQLPAGGSLELSSLKNPGGKTNLLIGDNNVATNANGGGVLDVSAGTFNATLGAVTLAQSPNASTNAYSTAVLTMGAGSATADSVVMAVTAASAVPQSTTALLRMVHPAGSFAVSGNVTDGRGRSTVQIDDGALTVGGRLAVDTVNLGGGTLAAGSIEQGIDLSGAVGGSAFNWTGGTLHVGTFGTPAMNFHLVQGGGTLAPGDLSPGSPVGTSTLWGNYTQDAGALEIQIAGAGAPGADYDLLKVEGNSPGGDLVVRLLGFEPALGDYFDVLEVAGGIAPGDWTILGDGAGAHNWAVTLLDRPGGGNILRLSAVPEPATLPLAALALLGLAGYGWSRAKKGPSAPCRRLPADC